MIRKILLVTDGGDVCRWHLSIYKELGKSAEIQMARSPAGASPGKRPSLAEWGLPLIAPELRCVLPRPPGNGGHNKGRDGDFDVWTNGKLRGFDLILDLTSDRSVPPQPSIPVWSLVTLDGHAFPRGLPFLEDAYRAGSVATLLLVERFVGRETDTVVDSITLAPTRRSYRSFLQGALRLSRMMLAAHAGRDPAFGRGQARGSLAAPERDGRRQVGLGALLRFCGRAIADHAWYQNKDKLLMEEWRIGYLDRPIASSLAVANAADARWLELGRNGDYIADPFGVPGSPDRLYCELYSWETGRGVISELSVTGQSCALSEPKQFGCEAHMSYPYLFEEDGNVYCVPEQLGTRAVTIFRYDRTTDRWQRFATPLTGVAAADPALFKLDGRYWIAFTDTGIDYYNNLCLVHSESLEGPWKRHELHPVKVDVRSARSAGTPFFHEGALYRPAQDCSLTYGGAIALNRVVSCTPHSYEEKVVGMLRPERTGPARHGLHTLSSWGNRTLIDGKRYRFSLSTLRRKLARKLSGKIAAMLRPRGSVAPGPATGKAFGEQGEKA